MEPLLTCDFAQQLSPAMSGLLAAGGSWCEGIMFCRDGARPGWGIALLLLAVFALRLGCMRKSSRRKEYGRFRPCPNCRTANPGIASFCSRCGNAL